MITRDCHVSTLYKLLHRNNLSDSLEMLQSIEQSEFCHVLSCKLFPSVCSEFQMNEKLGLKETVVSLW